MYACVLPNCSGQEPQRAARARHGGGAQARQHGRIVLDVQGAQAARREGLTEGGQAREDTRRAQQGKGQAGALRAPRALYGFTVVLIVMASSPATSSRVDEKVSRKYSPPPSSTHGNPRLHTQGRQQALQTPGSLSLNLLAILATTKPETIHNFEADIFGATSVATPNFSCCLCMPLSHRPWSAALRCT